MVKKQSESSTKSRISKGFEEGQPRAMKINASTAFLKHAARKGRVGGTLSPFEHSRNEWQITSA
jgi:hypothetical protein